MIIITVVRILFVVLVAYFMSRILFNFLEQMNIIRRKHDIEPTNTSQKNYIDICPECGRVKERNHRCP